MRRYLPRELRRRFDIAWKMVPDFLRHRLRRYIVDVRSVDSMKGASVKLKGGSSISSEQEANAWFVQDEKAGRGFIRLRNVLQDDPDEIETVFAVLHELAHAVEYLEDDRRAAARCEDRSETAACSQAMAWAARAASNNYGGGYERASEVALMALLVAEDEGKKWRRRKLGISRPEEVEHERAALIEDSTDFADDQTVEFQRTVLKAFADALEGKLEPREVTKKPEGPHD